jgi:hypothetical protein
MHGPCDSVLRTGTDSLRPRPVTSGTSECQHANPCTLPERRAGGWFWSRVTWEQGDDRRQGTTVVNWPE